VAHIPDGFLSLPVTAGAAATSAAALAYAARRARAALGERDGPVLGAATAFVFAAQMLNFPLGIGTSAHLIGGALLAVLLGPWVGMMALFGVLLVQALLFQDGGIAALGVNTLNLAVLGVGSAAIVFRWASAIAGPGRVATMVAAAVAAWTSTAVVGVAVSMGLVLSGLVPIRPALVVVGGGHALAGLAEAGLTAGLIGFLLRSRPDLVPATTVPPSVRRRTVSLTLGGLVVAAVAVLASSGQPDVLEGALVRFGLSEGTPTSLSPMGGRVPVLGSAWIAAAVGLLAAFVVAWGLAIAVARRRA
jgi:cobalt/nickel transport system permease protein